MHLAWGSGQLKMGTKKLEEYFIMQNRYEIAEKWGDVLEMLLPHDISESEEFIVPRFT